MQVFDTLHVYEDAQPRAAALNMAIDEALLELAPAPVLRFYRWARPAISFGYFGAYADVAMHHDRCDLVRRWTGGGIVFHGDDLTYSIVLPGCAAAPIPPARLIYAEVHSAIRNALAQEAGVTLARRAAPKISEACFANPVEADVMLGGRKIAGAAQRRTRAGLLHQGSIQHNALPGDFSGAFAAALQPRFELCTLSPAVLSRAGEIAAERYATAEWLHRR